jgi:hypothetical protein
VSSRAVVGKGQGGGGGDGSSFRDEKQRFGRESEADRQGGCVGHVLAQEEGQIGQALHSGFSDAVADLIVETFAADDEHLPGGGCKVDTLHRQKRHDPEELTQTVHDAWREYQPQKILTAFEMLNDVAAETLETDGHCPQEGKGRGGARRAHGGA